MAIKQRGLCGAVTAMIGAADRRPTQRQVGKWQRALPGGGDRAGGDREVARQPGEAARAGGRPSGLGRAGARRSGASRAFRVAEGSLRGSWPETGEYGLA